MIKLDPDTLRKKAAAGTSRQEGKGRQGTQILRDAAQRSGVVSGAVAQFVTKPCHIGCQVRPGIYRVCGVVRNPANPHKLVIQQIPSPVGRARITRVSGSCHKICHR